MILVLVLSFLAPSSGDTIAWGDLDGDGLADALLVDAAGQGRLFRNLGDGGFAELALGLDPGLLLDVRFARWEDVDRDGLADLLIAPGGDLRLLRNLGGVLDDVTAYAGLDGGVGAVRSVDCLDYDADGLPDLQLTGEAGSVLLHNTGDARFARADLPRTATGLPVEAAGLAAPAAPDVLPRGAAPPAPSGSRSRSATARTGRTPVSPAGAATSGGVATAGTPLPPGSSSAEALPFCAVGLRDAADPGGPCLFASSTPTLGMLYPMSEALNVTPAGRVGIGTTAPGQRLDVVQPGASGAAIRGSLVQTTLDPFAAGVIGSVPLGGTSGGIGVWGDHQGSGSGVYGTSFDGSGVVGLHQSSVGMGVGVLGQTSSESAGAVGVTGRVQSGNAGIASAGVKGQNNGTGTDGYGVQGVHLGGGIGVEGSASGLAGVGVHGSHASSTGSSPGILGETLSGSPSASGVLGRVSAVPGLLSAGVRGEITSPGAAGAGVYGLHLGSGIAVYGDSNGTGVLGNHSPPSGQEPGVEGLTQSTDDGAAAVLGVVVPTAPGDRSAGVRGQNNGTGGLGFGVLGTHAGRGNGVRGESSTGVGTFGFSTGSNGVVGETASPSRYGVFSAGDFGGTGAKYFVQPHPEDASKEIRFVCLEGNESGTYFRGSTRLHEGRSVIEVPEDFRLVSERDHLTVQLTAVGARSTLWVESKSLERIVVRGDDDVEVDYFVNGVRRGYADLETIRANVSFVPAERGVAFGAQYRPGMRAVLVENGILNADFTPNEATAARLGWTLREAPNARPGRARGPLAQPSVPGAVAPGDETSATTRSASDQSRRRVGS